MDMDRLFKGNLGKREILFVVAGFVQFYTMLQRITNLLTVYNFNTTPI